MKAAVLATLMVALAVCVFASSAGARPSSGNGSWIPGTSYMIEETDANSSLERGVDHAYCEGIPRFGHSGEVPYEVFTTFDCSWSYNGAYCSDGRYRAVKASPRGYFRLLKVRNANCY
jgi:hypothetical protein